MELIGWGKLMIRFEFKHLNKDNWEDVSEGAVLELVQENFVRVTTAIHDLLKGKTLLTSNGLCRVKKGD